MLQVISFVLTMEYTTDMQKSQAITTTVSAEPLLGSAIDKKHVPLTNVEAQILHLSTQLLQHLSSNVTVTLIVAAERCGLRDFRLAQVSATRPS